jgi:chorismate mutase/prephenate dehydratase
MTALSPDQTLDALRREIDSIDDSIVDLLSRRFAATAAVREAKARDGSIASSPFRPSREAAILRRLIARGSPDVPPETLVRLWRVILSSSTQSQAPITLHMDEALGLELGTRMLLAQHFTGMPVELHSSPAQALAKLENRQGDLAVIATSSDWAARYAAEDQTSVQVIATLPVLANGERPHLLVFGHADPQPSGDDETLVLTVDAVPQLPSMLWQARSGILTLTSLAGFLSSADPALRNLRTGLSSFRIAGRCPRPIKVSP